MTRAMAIRAAKANHRRKEAAQKSREAWHRMPVDYDLARDEMVYAINGKPLIPSDPRRNWNRQEFSGRHRRAVVDFMERM